MAFFIQSLPHLPHTTQQTQTPRLYTKTARCMSCIALQIEVSSSCVDINHRAALVLSAERQRLQMVSVAVAKEVEKHRVKQHQ